MWQGNVSLGDAFIISLTGMLVVMLELIIIAIFIVILSRIIRSFNKNKDSGNTEEKTARTVQKINPDEQKKTNGSGEVRADEVSEEELAIIMSAVSAQSGLPLEKMKFKSIKKI